MDDEVPLVGPVKAASLFGIVVGFALLLNGIGFVILALGALGRREWTPFAKRRGVHETATLA